MIKRTFTVLILLAAACPAAAGAAPFQLAAVGDSPVVAVDAAGNGHFVWNELVIGGTDVTHYCRIPPGGTECAASSTFSPTPGAGADTTDFDGPQVFVGGSTVIVMTHRCCSPFPQAGGDATLIFVSSDGGNTFGPAQEVGTETISGDAMVGPGARLSTISDVVTGGTFFQAMTPGTFTAANANLGDSGSLHSYSGTVGLIDANTPIGTFDDLETTFWRRWAGSGDYNDIANWTPTATVGPGTDGQLSYGVAGVWLLYLVGDPGDRTYVQRAYTGSGFGTAVPVTERGDPIFADFFQDPAGRNHAVWLDGDRDLVYRRADDAASYGPVTQLVASNFNIFHMRVAAGSDGEGWVVWDENSGTAPVHAAQLEVAPDPPQVGETVTVRVVEGEVGIKLPGSGSAHASQKGAGFVPLTEARTIPVRSILDTRKGTVALRSATNRAGKTQSGQFTAGRLPGAPVAQAVAEGADRAAAEGLSREVQELRRRRQAHRHGQELPVAPRDQAPARPREGALPQPRPAFGGHRARHRLEHDRQLRRHAHEGQARKGRCPRLPAQEDRRRGRGQELLRARTMSRAPASAVVLAWLALASPAVALEADPFEIADPGERPSIAVDNKGNAHFVWNESRDDASGCDPLLQGARRQHGVQDRAAVRPPRERPGQQRGPGRAARARASAPRRRCDSPLLRRLRAVPQRRPVRTQVREPGADVRLPAVRR